MDTLTAFEQKYRILRQHLEEYALRLCAAADAVTLGRGGVTLVAKASGLSRTTIYSGVK
jgi:DNA-binding phage protein